MFKFQQILLLISMFDLQIPETFDVIRKAMLYLINLEVYNIGEDLADYLGFDQDYEIEEPLKTRLEDFGLESLEFIVNEGNVILLHVIFYLLTVFVLVAPKMF